MGSAVGGATGPVLVVTINVVSQVPQFFSITISADRLLNPTVQSHCIKAAWQAVTLTSASTPSGQLPQALLLKGSGSRRALLLLLLLESC